MFLRHPLVRDLALCAAALVLSAALMAGAASLPPPRFEPLGSAALPRAMAVVIALMSVLLGVGAIRRHLSGDISEETEVEPGANGLKSLGVFAGLVAFVFALDVLRLPFELAATGFVAWAGSVIGGFSLRKGLALAVFGAALSFFVAWVLRTWLYIEF